ncbi:alpha/beta hydrolase [Thalassotalea psychrophila]|uniref:Alpha/beta hydrolase n=1 Tax=Thalassotalea psychrophila TaxID=3065647 RepID=A0ABY9TX03_9GAMM|nr:alpha/beta hydrolase [Colwelliaceae bacterium SQ149]
MRGVVSPKLENFLEQVNAAIRDAKANNITFTPEQTRINLNNLSALIPQGPEIALVKKERLNVQGRDVPVTIYNPDPERKLPVLIHYHGGGHMCGSVELYDPISRNLANICQCIVICVEYRLAPEHPYPAGINDCQQVLIRYKELLTDMVYGEQVYIIGDSAGGAICTTLSQQSLSNADIKIDKQILIYPSVDYTMSSKSMNENGHGFLLEQDKIKWYFEQYFQESSTNQEFVRTASPLYGTFSTCMPPTLIFTGGCDPLKDEGIAYGRSLENAGVEVENVHFKGMIHAYMLLHSLVAEECQQTYQSIAKFLSTT